MQKREWSDRIIICISSTNNFFLFAIWFFFCSVAMKAVQFSYCNFLTLLTHSLTLTQHDLIEWIVEEKKERKKRGRNSLFAHNRLINVPCCVYNIYTKYKVLNYLIHHVSNWLDKWAQIWAKDVKKTKKKTTAMKKRKETQKSATKVYSIKSLPLFLAAKNATTCCFASLYIALHRDGFCFPSFFHLLLLQLS